MSRKKQGDISSTTIVTVVLLLIGFGILLLFISRIYYSGTTEREVCRESVNLRGGVLAVTKGISDYVPLECKTQKVCVTSGLIGGNCEQDFQKEKVTKAKVDTTGKISKAISDEVLDCWDMMGQGRISLFTGGWYDKFGISGAKSSCVICSRIALDMKNLPDSVKTKLGDVNVYNYMATHTIAGQKFSYLQYMAQGSPAGVSVADVGGKLEQKDFQYPTIKNKTTFTEVPAKIIDETKQNPEVAVVFMQIHVTDLSTVLRNDAIAAGVLFASAPATTVKVLSSGYGAAAAIILGLAAIGYQTYNTFNNYEIATGYCGDMMWGKDPSYGCSAVRVVNYNLESLKTYCNVIESIP